MKLSITKRQQGKYTFYETEVLGAKVTLSKALTDDLSANGLLKRTVETTDRMTLCATSKTASNGKVYTNLFLTLKKGEKPASKSETDDDIPF